MSQSLEHEAFCLHVEVVSLREVPNRRTSSFRELIEFTQQNGQCDDYFDIARGKVAVPDMKANNKDISVGTLLSRQ